jgi:uncharacterized membrane protein YhaH (DUF805 family)
MRNKYVMALLIVALAIILPGGVARLFGASIHILAVIATAQLFALFAFFITCLASLALGVRAAIDKEWRKALAFGGATLIPLATWGLATFANRPGWEAVMGI